VLRLGVAAICRSNGALLATRNTKDFSHTGIRVSNPWEASEADRFSRPTPS
jgi:hypothetical protein